LIEVAIPETKANRESTSMLKHHFISYSTQDASEFAARLRDKLVGSSFPTWMDERDLSPGEKWPEGVKEAIDTCKRFLFIISRQSVKKTSFCRQELQEARRKQKLIIPIRFHSDAKPPKYLQKIQHIDFSGDFSAGLARLLPYLRGPLVINSPPLQIPSHFRGRKDGIRSLCEFVLDDANPLVLVVGREGSGKSAVACYVLDNIERCAWDDNRIRPRVDAIIYLNSTNYCRSSWPRLFHDLSILLSNQRKRDVERVFMQPGMTVTLKMQGLLTALAGRKILVLLDHLDDVIDASTAEILDSELTEALRALLKHKSHSVKLIITSQVTPKDLLFTLPAGQSFIDLGHGLALSEAEQVLHALDNDRQLGLTSVSQKFFGEICHRTQGNPRALEVLCALLRTDRDTSLGEVLQKTKGLLPDEVLEVLVGRAFHRLDPVSQKIMQALAIYARPVTIEAVNHLLQPHLSNASIPSLLRRLVNMQLARKEGAQYCLHETDREYALSTISEGRGGDQSETDTPPFTRLALLHRAADYFGQLGKPPDEQKALEDLAPRLAEFDLRYQAREYEPSARILADIEETLFAWGQYRQVAEYHERLRGKLDDLRLNRHQFDTLGRVNHRLGNLEQAIHCYEEGLRYVRRMQDDQGECLYLSNLAICLMESGQLDLAIAYCGLTFDLARKLRDSPRQAHVVNTLSDCLAYVGKVSESIKYCEQSLALARDCMRRELEVVALANMGQHYGELGETDKALGKCDKAVHIAQAIEFQLGEATAFRNLADLHIDNNKLKQALEYYKKAIELADMAQSAQLQQTIRTGLALALLFSGELTGARTSGEAACQYDVRALNCEAFAVLGVIAQRLEDGRAARDAFNKAVQHADAMLGKTPQAYKALDAKGLALSGLALLEGSNEYLDYLEDSIDAYQAARRFTSDAGIVRRVLRCFDELAKADLAERLASVRQAAAGNEPMSHR
jgi:tetratricopeptide (TPR) repeat protein